MTVPALIRSTHPQHRVLSSEDKCLHAAGCFLSSRSDDKKWEERLPASFSKFVLIRKYFCAAAWKWEWRASSIFFLSQWDAGVYPSPPVSGQTAPSHELPQTHLQKIRHEIVWLLHHQGPSAPSHLHSLVFCCLLGLHVSQTAWRLLLTCIRSFFHTPQWKLVLGHSGPGLGLKIIDATFWGNFSTERLFESLQMLQR